MGITVQYPVKCPLCDFTDIWSFHTTSGPGEGQFPPARHSTKEQEAELENEHPDHPVKDKTT